MKVCACRAALDSPARLALTTWLIADQSTSVLLEPRRHRGRFLQPNACARPASGVRQLRGGGRCVALPNVTPMRLLCLHCATACRTGNDGGTTCTRCPIGTYSPGGTKESCTPCGFGSTSPPGSTSSSQCQPVAVTCPSGQIAPVGAVSAAQCACQPGFGGACCCGWQAHALPAWSAATRRGHGLMALCVSVRRSR